MLSSEAGAFNVFPHRFNSESTSAYEYIVDIFSKAFVSKYTDPVHEKITALAKSCILKSRCYLKDLEFTPYDIDPLIIGVRWNDDPLALMPGAEVGFKSRFDRGKIAAKRGKRIDSRYSMLSRSHFGDMQFLHSMANANNISPTETRKKILDWLVFCYKISIGELSDKMSLKNTEMSQYFPEAGDKCFSSSKPNCIGDLFDIYGEHRNAKPQRPISDIALGAMLHTVQDSFSRSHVKRIDQTKIVQFYSYVDQCEDKHGKEDAMPYFLRSGDVSIYLPILYSKRIIQIHDKGKGEENYLDMMKLLEEVYLLAENDKQVVSGPGEYKC